MPNDEFATDYLDLPPHRLNFSLRAELPQHSTASGNAAMEDMNDNEQDALCSLPLRSSNCIGQLLGHVSSIGLNPGEGISRMSDLNPERFGEHENKDQTNFFAPIDWLNLLRLDSIMEINRKINFLIRDAGYLNFLIHRDDLQKRDFARVYAAVESS